MREKTTAKVEVFDRRSGTWKPAGTARVVLNKRDHLLVELARYVEVHAAARRKLGMPVETEEELLAALQERIEP